MATVREAARVCGLRDYHTFLPDVAGTVPVIADEQSFQAAVVEVARLAGWRVAHFRAARTAKGWRTPVTADGAGWPDLALARPPQLVFAELKSDAGEATDRQLEWLDVLRLLPQVEVYLWRPADWDALVEVLTGSLARKTA